MSDGHNGLGITRDAKDINRDARHSPYRHAYYRYAYYQHTHYQHAHYQRDLAGLMEKVRRQVYEGMYREDLLLDCRQGNFSRLAEICKPECPG